MSDLGNLPGAALYGKVQQIDRDISCQLRNRGQYESLTAQYCAIVLKSAHYVHSYSDANFPRPKKLGFEGRYRHGGFCKSLVVLDELLLG